MSEKTFGERFDNIEKILKLKFGGINYETIKKVYDEHEQSMKDLEKEELETTDEKWNWIETYIKDEKGETVFEIKGKISLQALHSIVQLTGLDLSPHPMPIPTRLPRTSCKQRAVCTEDYEKCADCGNNESKSHFKPKTEE